MPHLLSLPAIRSVPMALLAAALAVTPISARPQTPSASAEALLAGAQAAVGIRPGGPTIRSLRLMGTRLSTQGLHADCREGIIRVSSNETAVEMRVGFPDRFLTTRAAGSANRGFGFVGDRPVGAAAADSVPWLRATIARLMLGMIAQGDMLPDARITIAGPSAVLVEGGPEGPAHVRDTLELDAATRLPLRLVRRTRMIVREPSAIIKRFDPSDPSCGGIGVGAVGADVPAETVTMTFEDRRDVGGFLLPHRITTSAKGVALQELTYKTIEVNPRFTDEDFQ